MKKNRYILFFLITSLFQVRANDSFNKDKDGVITIETTKLFHVEYFKLPDDSIAKKMPLELTVIYTNKDSNSAKSYSIKVKVGDTTSQKFRLTAPLDMSLFQDRINSEVNTLSGAEYIIFQGSFNDIYFWVASIGSFDQSKPMSGSLILMPYALVISKTDDNSTHKSRVKKVSSKVITLKKHEYIGKNRLGDIDSLVKIKQEQALLKKNKIDLETVESKRNLIQKGISYLLNFPVKLAADNSLFKAAGVDPKTVKSKGDSIITKNKVVLYSGMSEKKRKVYLDSIKKADTAYYGKMKNIVALYDTSMYRVDSVLKSIKRDSIYQIKRVSIQIERGFIERVQVWILDQFDRETIFENIYAIGFSSIKNFGRFEKTRLYARYGFNDDSHIYLSDVFSNYDNILENYTRDYSPADTAINNATPESGMIELRRNEFVDLFDTKIFTDLNGIKPNSPNGLIQIGVNRRFTLHTSRQQVGLNRADIGWLEYFNAFGSYNKIESDQRYLALRNEEVGQNGELLSPSYATNLDFRQYENFSLGAELNAFLFDWPDGKFTAFLDLGAKYGHTPVVDKRRVVINDVVTNPDKDTLTYNAHTTTWYPKLSIEIFSERRVGFFMSYQFNTTTLHSNNDFKQITSYAKSDLLSRTLERSARLSHTVELYLRAEPTTNRNGRLFLRARFFIQQRDRNTFFSQIQVGYSYNLLFKK